MALQRPAVGPRVPAPMTLLSRTGPRVSTNEACCFSWGGPSAYMQRPHALGPDAGEPTHQCYGAVNVISDHHGSCGIMGASSCTTCTKCNSLCGRTPCINVKTHPDVPGHTTIVPTPPQGVGYHGSLVPLGISDVGGYMMVPPAARTGYA